MQEGNQAPEFVATTSDGREIRLSQFLGKQGVVLFFYPKDGTRVCTAEACAFRDSYAKFTDAGFEVIGISADTDASHTDFAAQHRLPFPLISDANGNLRKLFEVPKTLALLPGRVTYVIDKLGIIRRIFSAFFASDEHVQNALNAVEQLD